ncbi:MULTISPECIES: FecR domain-containing protein [unclassified Pseudoalteromonas]|uniref:FecR domain-containing protein n=1 Tax=unclassified Pseudoalteromonas TaxID=194690 RepID=UPI00209684C3|nr:FecR domain-containing protein [Pseudoalteromonas sp. XMcav2-N]MCO7188097.1 FecR domain-containing protein [Pseudoalteromonas sp. XMcav2-N]
MLESSHTSLSISEEVVRQAIAWRVRLESRGQDGDIVRACEQWRQAEPEHEQAWQRLCMLDATFNKVTDSSTELVKQTIINTDSEVKLRGRRQAIKTLGGSAFALASVSWLSYEQGLLDPIYTDHSTRGEKAHVALADNSQLWLNQHSSVSVDYSDTWRRIEVPRGEIHLSAAKDKRPFEVHSSHGVLSTLWAQFNLREGKDASVIQVDEGEVWIAANSGYAQRVKAGEVVQFSQYDTDQLVAEMFDYSAWVNGFLSVRDIPLQQLLSELGRYRTGILRSDPKLAKHPISGVFQLNDHDLILKTLAHTLGAELQYRTRFWVQLSLKANA